MSVRIRQLEPDDNHDRLCWIAQGPARSTRKRVLSSAHSRLGCRQPRTEKYRNDDECGVHD